MGHARSRHRTLNPNQIIPNTYKNPKKFPQNRSNTDPELVSTQLNGTKISELVSTQLNGTKVRAMYSYNVEENGTLQFFKGDILYVKEELDHTRSWWFAEHSTNRKKGFIPKNYVTEVDGSPMALDCWFNISRAETEKKLNYPGYPQGTYIIRPSTDPNNYALSIRYFNENNGIYEVRHYKIRVLDNGGYYISNTKQFPTIEGLISHYSENESGLCCNLTKPFPIKHKPPVQFKEMEVIRKSLSMVKVIGNGSFGEVWLAKWNHTLEVAIKMMKQNADDPTQRKDFIEEAKRMHQLNHPRIVELLGICSEPEGEPIYIITELIEKGALLSYLRSEAGNLLDLEDMILMMNHIADGMEYLETKNFIHRDLRAANILVCEDLSVKVADFGLSRIIEDVYCAKAGSKFPVRWTAPEAAIKQEYTAKSDVWSYGILMYEIVTFGQMPYSSLEVRSVIQEIATGYRMPNPNGGIIKCPPELYNIMTLCWKENPLNRPTFKYLKQIFDDYFVSTEGNYDFN